MAMARYGREKVPVPPRGARVPTSTPCALAPRLWPQRWESSGVVLVTPRWDSQTGIAELTDRKSVV